MPAVVGEAVLPAELQEALRTETAQLVPHSLQELRMALGAVRTLHRAAEPAEQEAVRKAVAARKQAVERRNLAAARTSVVEGHSSQAEAVQEELLELEQEEPGQEPLAWQTDQKGWPLCLFQVLGITAVVFKKVSVSR